MRKFFMVLFIALLATSLCFAGSKKEAEEAVDMFQLKVEIKDAIDAYAVAYSAETGVNVTIETLGGGGDYGGALKAKAQAGDMPDIFVIEGQGGYDLWKDYIADLSDQPWVKDTDLAFTQDGTVYGFPVAIEGYGLAYNAEILEAAGIDPTTLTTRDAYEEAFEIIDSKKDELGLDSVVSLGASIAGGMWWVATNHNFPLYLGGGLDYDDKSVLNDVLAGKVDDDRLEEYAKYVQLLFKYSDPNVLANGSYDQQMAAFSQGKAAFLHQGNWVEPQLVQLGVTFDMGFAPHAFLDEEQEGLYVFAPSWYCVNEKSPNAEAAKEFLNAMATTTEGHEYMVNEAGMVPAFKSVSLRPAGPLSKAVMEANANVDNYAQLFGMLPDGFTQNSLGPVYDLFAQDPDNIDQFIADMENAIENIPSK